MVSLRPTLVFYCQHSIGLGHLVRSLALIDGLAERFDVVLLNGGRMPETAVVPVGVQVVNLPPLGQPTHDLISHDASLSVGQALQIRRDTMLRCLDDHRPAAVVIELFPFGRKKFGAELLPFLDAIHAGGGSRPIVVSSVRDLLVGDRPDQADHDERASTLCNRYFDAVLVHADPRFARLEETFRPRTPLAIPVHYTGFVTAPATGRIVEPSDRRERVLVSAGGGMVGEPIFRAAVDAQRRLHAGTGTEMTVVAGPFAPDSVWEWLVDAADGVVGLDVVRSVADLEWEMRRSVASVSQCGYNTAMDILRARVPALVVPYAERRDTEQTDRARRLVANGVIRVLPHRELSGDRMAAEVRDLLSGFAPAPADLDLDGRRSSARLLGGLIGVRAA